MKPIRRTESILIPPLIATNDFAVPEAILFAESVIASSGGELPLRRPQRENSMSLAKGLLEEVDSAGLSPVRRTGAKTDDSSIMNFRLSKMDFSNEKKRGRKLEQLKKLVNLSSIVKQDQLKNERSKNPASPKPEGEENSAFKLDDLLLNSRTTWYRTKPQYKGIREIDLDYSKTIGEIRWRATSNKLEKPRESDSRVKEKSMVRNRCCGRDEKSHSVSISTDSQKSFVRSKSSLPQSDESSPIKKAFVSKKKIEINLEDMEKKYVPLLNSIGLKGIMRVSLCDDRNE